MPSRECQQPVGQGCRAVGRVGGCGCVALQFTGSALADPVLHHLDRAENACEKIVEIVSDAAGQLADCLHFLGLAKGLFRLQQNSCLLLLGSDVAPHRIDQLLVGNSGPLKPAETSIPMPESALEMRRCPAAC